MNKPRTTEYKPGDEVAYATPSGMIYGTVKRMLGGTGSSAVEIQFEDGRTEIKKTGDRALSLVRRASGASEAEERRPDHEQVKDPDIERIRRSEQRRR